MPDLTTIRRRWCDKNIPRIQQVARSLGRFTSDDIRGYQTIKEPAHPNWWGVAIAQMKNLGMIRRVGFRKSAREEANGRWIMLWEVRR